MNAASHSAAVPRAGEGQGRSHATMVVALAAGVLLLAAPWLVDGSTISILCQIGIAMVLALSFNILLGQTGVLSFGHSLYSGVAGFFTAHAMNAAGAGGFALPLVLVPFVGAVAGAVLGVVFGYAASRRNGMPFAMITLGTVELVHAASLIFDGFFGGESGITTNRVYGTPFLGLTFGPQSQVYYLILAWLVLSAVLMYQFRLTPLGRMAFALRDNPARTEFLGYDSGKIRFLSMIVACIFAGVAGSLSAIMYEIVTHESVSVGASAMILVYTFIGGTALFYGPLIGAVIGVLMTAVASGMFAAWYLYLGLLFIAVVVWAPAGVAGLINSSMLVHRHGKVEGLWLALGTTAAPLLVGIAGFIALAEMLYHRTFIVGGDTSVKVFGMYADTASPIHWLVAAATLACGLYLFLRTRRAFLLKWGHAQEQVQRALLEEAPR